MNTYKLADELKKCIDDGFTDLVCVFDAVNMLRQQADRIAELEKECDLAKDQWDKDRICFKARIAELEDRLSMYEIKDLDRGIIGRTKDYVIHDLVHRTTPQIKELSDEEIEKVRVVIMEAAYWCAENGDSESYNAVKVMCSKVLAMLRGEK